jgi:prophage regulatory protein
LQLKVNNNRIISVVEIGVPKTMELSFFAKSLTLNSWQFSFSLLRIAMLKTKPCTSNTLQQEPTLPTIGMSRWSQIKYFVPFSKEKFRQLSLEKKAPQPIRLGIRCTFFRNEEIHRFLEDPLNYSAK